VVIARHLHLLAIVAAESEDTAMTENQIVGVMNGTGLHPLTTQTKEVGMTIAPEAQEHLVLCWYLVFFVMFRYD
jgi:hypothetical protein